MPVVATSSPLGEDDLEFQRSLAGLYTIEREIGRGGMGIVYLGREVLLDRPVAIKRLPLRDGPPDARVRFVREARTAARLFHPNIVPVHSVDTAGAFVFFVMGFVDGESLGQRVQRRGPMPVADALKVLRETAWALGYAHARGVVHRDVKPDNLLIENDSQRTFVTDFGLAHDAGTSSLTAEGVLMGSILYMSPEQIAGEPVDGRSDLYALGIVAHYLLTGAVPFDHPSARAVMSMHATRTAPRIASLVPGIPSRLAGAIDRCLEKDPSARFQTAEGFADAISDVERSQQVAVPLRAWAAGAGWTDAGFVAMVLIAFVSVAFFAPLWLMLMPLVYAIGQRIRHTRRLLLQGYDVSDIQRALVAELQSRSEETAAGRTRITPRWIRMVRALFIGSAVALVALVLVSPLVMKYVLLAGDSLPTAVNNSLLVAAAVSLTFAVLGALSAERIIPSHLLARPQDTGIRVSLQLWRSKAGSWLARLLQFRHRGAAIAGADRPTEFVIGSAASALFAALPGATRKQFAEVPDCVARLEAHAQRLRARRESIDRIVSSVQQFPSHSTSQATSVGQLRAQTVDELRRTREELDGRLAAIVAALETIRLDLLRLHVGRGETADLTNALDAAVKINNEVTIALESWSEVERLVETLQ